jgi:hypothetical protein
MDKKSPKSTGCSSGSSEGIMRWNSDTGVRFPPSMLFGHLLKKKMHWINVTGPHPSVYILNLNYKK